MKVYASAWRHSLLGMAWFIAFIPIMIVGDSLEIGFDLTAAFYAFVSAVIGLRLFLLACPRCRKSLFKRGIFYWPWPERTCSKCGLDMAGSDSK